MAHSAIAQSHIPESPENCHSVPWLPYMWLALTEAQAPGTCAQSYLIAQSNSPDLPEELSSLQMPSKWLALFINITTYAWLSPSDIFIAQTLRNIKQMRKIEVYIICKILSCWRESFHTSLLLVTVVSHLALKLCLVNSWRSMQTQILVLLEGKLYTSLLLAAGVIQLSLKLCLVNPRRSR